MSQQEGSSKVEDIVREGNNNEPQQMVDARVRHRRHVRAYSSSSEGTISEVKKVVRHMDKILLHPSKTSVFQTLLNDPSARLSARSRPAESNVQDHDDVLLDERDRVAILNQARAPVAFVSRETGESVLDSSHSIHSVETVPIGEVYEGEFSDRASPCSVSSRGLSSSSSAPSSNSDSEMELIPLASIESPSTDDIPTAELAGPSGRLCASDERESTDDHYEIRSPSPDDVFMVPVPFTGSDEDSMPAIEDMLFNIALNDQMRFQQPPKSSTSSGTLDSEPDSSSSSSEELDNAANEELNNARNQELDNAANEELNNERNQELDNAANEEIGNAGIQELDNEGNEVLDNAAYHVLDNAAYL